HDWLKRAATSSVRLEAWNPGLEFLYQGPAPLAHQQLIAIYEIGRCTACVGKGARRELVGHNWSIRLIAYRCGHSTCNSVISPALRKISSMASPPRCRQVAGRATAAREPPMKPAPGRPTQRKPP